MDDAGTGTGAAPRSSLRNANSPHEGLRSRHVVSEIRIRKKNPALDSTTGVAATSWKSRNSATAKRGSNMFRSVLEAVPGVQERTESAQRPHTVGLIRGAVYGSALYGPARHIYQILFDREGFRNRTRMKRFYAQFFRR